MLIDNVGLYRIFGLPARNHDWAAMFEGRMIGNAPSRARTDRQDCTRIRSLPEEERQQEEGTGEMVITHDRLMEARTGRKQKRESQSRLEILSRPAE